MGDRRVGGALEWRWDGWRGRREGGRGGGEGEERREGGLEARRSREWSLRVEVTELGAGLAAAAAAAAAREVGGGGLGAGKSRSDKKHVATAMGHVVPNALLAPCCSGHNTQHCALCRFLLN
jgi:hypothetical protein